MYAFFVCWFFPKLTFRKLFQEYLQSDKQFADVFRSWLGSKLFVKAINSRQKSSLARKEFKELTYTDIRFDIKI